MSIETQLAGILFYGIISTNIASNRFGYSTTSDMDKEANLVWINENPRDFKIGFTLIFVEHIFLILLAVMMFFAFGEYSLILGVIWVSFRGTEGLIQIFNKKNYWKLLDIAKQYSSATRDENNTLENLRVSILKSKRSNFAIAQIFFSIGTLAYSILFVTSEVVPILIGWFGVTSAIIYGLGSGISLTKPESQIIWNIGGLLILIFEIILGGWLIFFT